MNRIHEVYQHAQLIVPVSQDAAGNTTGAYKSIVDSVHDLLITVNFGALAAGKKVTVEVFQADNASGTNAAEITAAQTEFTSPTGGVTEGQVMISVDKSLLSKPYITCKVTNDAAVALLVEASLLFEKGYRGSDVNSQANAITVI